MNYLDLIDAKTSGSCDELEYLPDGTSHLLDITTSDYMLTIYELGIGVTWKDLNDYEKRLVYESLRLRLQHANNEIEYWKKELRKARKCKKPTKVRVRRKENNHV